MSLTPSSSLSFSSRQQQPGLRSWTVAGNCCRVSLKGIHTEYSETKASIKLCNSKGFITKISENQEHLFIYSALFKKCMKVFPHSPSENTSARRLLSSSFLSSSVDIIDFSKRFMTFHYKKSSFKSTADAGNLVKYRNS